MLTRLCKPWFVYQPRQLLRRFAGPVSAPAGPDGYAPLPTSWGATVLAHPARDIGKSILATGVFDLAVSEALARLITPGDTVLDAGANVGSMTLLAAACAGPAGRVVSCEPYPEIFGVVSRNAAALAAGHDCSTIDLRQSAPGTAELQLPPDFALNDGISKIGPAGMGPSVTVPVKTIDDVLAGGSAAVVKMDVEGYEAQVLRGASATLAAGRIRHLVFEDHAIEGSAVAATLRAAGYTIYALGWSLRRPVIRPVERGTLAKSYEAPNYLATNNPSEAASRLRPAGWRVFDPTLARPR